MDILTVFLNKIAYKFSKGYPDLKDPKDIQFLLEIIEGKLDPIPLSYYIKNKNVPLFEGISFTNGKYTFNPQNSMNDLLIYKPDTTDRKGTTVYYSFEINPKIEGGAKFKMAADAIKNLDNSVAFETLEDPIREGIRSSMANLKPDAIYYLGSSKGLSSFLGDIAQDMYPDVEVLPLTKKTFPIWKDMLIDDYQTVIKNPTYVKAVEKEAERMWNAEGGKIKSSGYTPRFRSYFKPKYELEDILDTKRILFLDDNVQSGTDLSIIEKSVEKGQCFFYTPIILPRDGSNKSPKEQAAKTIKVDLTKADLKIANMFKTFTQNGEKRLYMSAKHPKYKRLQTKNFIEDNSIQHPTLGRFHRFANPKIVTIDDITPID